MRRFVLSILAILLISFPIQAKEHQLLISLGLKKGMDRETVMKVLGDPKRIKKQNTCWGMEERWWYDRKILTDKVILFSDGKLDKIETVEGKGSGPAVKDLPSR